MEVTLVSVVNAISRVLCHGGALEDEEVSSLRTLEELNARWVQRADKQLENYPEFPPSVEWWGKRKHLLHRTGRGRCEIEAFQPSIIWGMIVLRFFAGPENIGDGGRHLIDVRLDVKDFCGIEVRWEFISPNLNELLWGRADRLDLLHRFDRMLEGQIRKDLDLLIEEYPEALPIREALEELDRQIERDGRVTFPSR